MNEILVEITPPFVTSSFTLDEDFSSQGSNTMSVVRICERTRVIRSDCEFPLHFQLIPPKESTLGGRFDDLPSFGASSHRLTMLTTSSKLDVKVDTTSSHYNSHTSRPNFFTQAFDTNECVAPESYNTH